MARKPSHNKKHTLIETALEKQTSSFRTWFFDEPSLELGNGGKCVDPKTGISLYGPWGATDDTNIKNIRVGIIGTGDTITSAVHWLEKCKRTVSPDASDEMDPILFPSFPGLESKQGFSCSIEFPNRLQVTLTPAEIARCTSASNRDQAVEEMTKVVRIHLEALADKDSPPNVVIVALPSNVREAAGAGRTPPKNKKPKKQPSGPQQLSFLDLPPPTTQPEATSRTLHRAIKAEGMRVGLATQMAWPGTFTGLDGVQDASTRAWNFCTALYYKAGGIPWRVSGLQKDTCYIGITFFRPANDTTKLQTSLAQAFSDSGDGIVLRGETFEWDPRTQGEPHLTADGAKKLILGVIEQYSKHLRTPPKRIVIHKSSSFSEDEIKGMTEAIGNIPYYDFISVGRSNVRFMRMGAEPPVRGTAIEVAPKKYIFYTGGYVPFLKVYPGMRIPSPLSISHQAGSSAVNTILSEILSLTKMNWNSSAFASATPITVDFANNVGLILSELPSEINPRPYYRFYM